MSRAGPVTRVLAVAVLAFAAAAQATVVPPVSESPAPVEAPAPPTANALSEFDRFELVDPGLDEALLGPDGNERARRELQMHLRDALGPWLEARNAEPTRGAAPRALRIEPTIVQLDYVDPAVRFAVGPWPGTERLHVRVRFVDAATGEAVSETTLRADGSALVNVAPLGATSAALPRKVAKALADHLSAAVAGAEAPGAADVPD
jgi:hypothetical protein